MNMQDPEFAQFVQEVAGAVGQLNQQQAPSQPPVQQQQQAQPVVLTVDGQQYQFQNQQDLEATLTNTFQQFRGKIDELENATSSDDSQSSQQEQFDNKLFMEKMSTDPLAAMDYADQFRQSAPAAALKPVEELQQKVQQQEYTLAAYQFKEAHPEFAAHPQGHQILKGIMQQNNWDLNYQNLEAALAIGQMRGQFPTRQQFEAFMQQQAQAAQQQQMQAQVPDLSQFQQPPPQAQPQFQQPAPPNTGVPPMPQQQFQPPMPGTVASNPLQQQFNQGPVVPPPPQVPGGQTTVVPPQFISQAENMTADQLEQAIGAMTAGAPPQL